MLKIVTVKSLSQVEDFVMFPFKLYKDCNYWVPPIIKEEIEAMNFEKNPVFKNFNIILKKYLKIWSYCG